MTTSPMSSVVPAVPFPLLPTGAEEKDEELRRSFVRDEDERPKDPHNVFSNEIPVISLDGIDDVDRRAVMCQKIVDACEDWGVFQVIDHGVDVDLISQMTSYAKEFFALPPEEKLRYDMTGGKKGGFLVSSHLQKEVVRDWREIFTFFSYPIDERDYSRWPDNPQGWTPVVDAYSQNMMALADKLLEVLSEAMGMDREALKRSCIDMQQKLVLNSYPKCPDPHLILGLKRHTDPGTITLLLQDQVGGLQVTNDGAKTWITVQPIPGAIVVNLGDHAHFLSNGRFKNADHQAVVNKDSSRISIATFQNPVPEAVVFPLAVREGEDPIIDKPMTYADMYKNKMARDIDLANQKKLATAAGRTAAPLI
ncbi:Naringenin,2-oxoglutarate 3-dioxygenase [Zostera marina]|uniref:flavanone 3-dioxygenase n=1 Tax=Zostera marina TaxID=29655 RepID=A0A0K9PGJ6_ZOSMR|nr:Naringenin,2-oxoglutarate 3-dioxygenase [Zostera marina]